MKTKSHFSLKYGIHSPEAIVQWAADSGYPYVFLADINSTGAILAFVREAQRKGILPVVGVELRNEREKIATVIARNNHGLNELNVFFKSVYSSENFSNGLAALFKLLCVLSD